MRYLLRLIVLVCCIEEVFRGGSGVDLQYAGLRLSLREEPIGPISAPPTNDSLNLILRVSRFTRTPATLGSKSD